MPQIRGDIEPQLMGIPYHSDIDVPVPYMRWSGNAAVIVLANRNETADARVTLTFYWTSLAKSFRALATRSPICGMAADLGFYTARQLSSFVQVVKHDKTPRGGIGLIKIESIR